MGYLVTSEWLMLRLMRSRSLSEQALGRGVREVGEVVVEAGVEVEVEARGDEESADGPRDMYSKRRHLEASQEVNYGEIRGRASHVLRVLAGAHVLYTAGTMCVRVQADPHVRRGVRSDLSCTQYACTKYCLT